MKKNKKGKAKSAERREAKVKRRAKRKEKLAQAVIGKIRPLLMRIEQLNAQLKLANAPKENTSERSTEGKEGQA